MRLLTNNLATKDNTTVNNELTTFPVANQYNNVLVEKTYIEDYQDVDLGSAQNIKAIAFKYTQISSTPTITLYGASTLGGSDYSIVLTEDVTFIDETWQYWRLEGDIPFYSNYLDIGDYLQFPGVQSFPTPDENNTDNVNITNSGQIYVTEGTVLKEISVPIAWNTQAEYQAFIEWYRSSDRKNNHFLVLFEDCMDVTPFEPFFCKLMGNISPSRDRLALEYTLTFREGK